MGGAVPEAFEHHASDMNEASNPADESGMPPLHETIDALTQLEALKTQLAEAEARAAASKDGHVRALAELDNVRKRVEREFGNAAKFSNEKILGDLLNVADSLDLGLRAAGASDAQVTAIAEGMQLTRKQLLALLEKHGVTAVDPIGTAFNPELHEAVTMLESADVAPNHVLSVMQKGYKLHERLLRPAMVVVARAPALN